MLDWTQWKTTDGGNVVNFWGAEVSYLPRGTSCSLCCEDFGLQTIKCILRVWWERRVIFRLKRWKTEIHWDFVLQRTTQGRGSFSFEECMRSVDKVSLAFTWLCRCLNPSVAILRTSFSFSTGTSGCVSLRWTCIFHHFSAHTVYQKKCMYSFQPDCIPYTASV